LIDGIGTGLSDFPSSEACQEWLAEKCRTAGKELWIEVEAFDSRYNSCYWERLKRQIEMASPYGDRIVVFDVPHYFSPKGIAPKASELYGEYGKFLSSLEVERSHF